MWTIGEPDYPVVTITGKKNPGYAQEQCNGELRCICAREQEGAREKAWGGSHAHPVLLGRLDEERGGRSRRRLAWSAAHVTDENTLA